MRRFKFIVPFAAAALALAVVGVYGVTSYSVAARTREVGVRMALGAHYTGIASMIVRQELVAVIVGIAAGGLASFWIVRLMRA